jgi:hypothetical protein
MDELIKTIKTLQSFIASESASVIDEDLAKEYQSMVEYRNRKYTMPEIYKLISKNTIKGAL